MGGPGDGVHDCVPEIAGQTVEDWELGENDGLSDSSVDDFNLKQIFLQKVEELNIFTLFLLVGLVNSARVSKLLFEFEENDDDVEDGHHVIVELATSNLVDQLDRILLPPQPYPLHLGHQNVHQELRLQLIVDRLESLEVVPLEIAEDDLDGFEEDGFQLILLIFEAFHRDDVGFVVKGVMESAYILEECQVHQGVLIELYGNLGDFQDEIKKEHGDWRNI